MDEQQPLISIIVPVYNVEPYLKKCLDSIIGQTYINFEVIIVDDASTDASGELCDTYALFDSRLKVDHLTKNLGLSAARNVGIRKAKGEYITFIDSDDYVESILLERLYKDLTVNEADISICGYSRVGYYKNAQDPEQGSACVYTGNEAISCAVRSNPFGFTAWGKLYSAGIVKDNLFNESVYLNEDIPFFYQLGKKVKKVSYFPDPLYHYVYRGDSLVNGNFSERKCTVLLVYKYLHQDISENFPELLLETERKILDISISLAFRVVESKILKRHEIIKYLKMFQTNIHTYFNYHALILCPKRKIAAIIVLYISTMGFWGISTIYNYYTFLRKRFVCNMPEPPHI